jgi:biopolymer transport protein ExbD
MRPRRPTVVGFDLTPMIDVVMLLIIFFLVTSQFSRSIRTPIRLPEQAGSDERRETEGAIVVDLLADGSLRVEGEEVTLDVFAAMVGSEAAGRGKADPVLIRPDRDARAAHLNRLTRRLTEQGVSAYRIATVPPAASVP